MPNNYHLPTCLPAGRTTNHKQTNAFTLMSKALKESLGFTLIELLVSIAILSLVGILAIPNFTSFEKTQVLENEAETLSINLKKARVGAQTKTKCSIVESVGWRFTMIDKTTYKTENLCLDILQPLGTNSPLPSPSAEINQSVKLKSGIEFTSVITESSSCLLTEVLTIDFIANDVNFKCNGNDLLGNTLEIEVKDIKTSDSKTVKTNKAGSIYYE